MLIAKVATMFKLRDGRTQTTVGFATLVAAAALLAVDLPCVRGISWGLPAALFVIGFLFLEPYVASSSWAMRLVPLGGASYSLYLSHALLVPAVVSAIGYFLGASVILIVVVATLVSVVFSIVSCRFIESPMTRWLTIKSTPATSVALP